MCFGGAAADDFAPNSFGAGAARKRKAPAVRPRLFSLLISGLGAYTRKRTISMPMLAMKIELNMRSGQ